MSESPGGDSWLCEKIYMKKPIPLLPVPKTNCRKENCRLFFTGRSKQNIHPESVGRGEALGYENLKNTELEGSEKESRKAFNLGCKGIDRI